MPTSYNTGPDQQLKHDFTSNFFSTKKPIVLGTLTFVILACLTGLLAYQRYLINEDEVKKHTYDLLAATKEKLQDALAQGVSATKTLSFFIPANGLIKNFDSVASQLLDCNKDLDGLQLVPDGVIRYVSPLKGNEAVLGYNILQDPTRNKEAYKAIKTKQIFFAGPLLLRQGGIAVVGRLPVYRNNRFWGFSAVVIKLTTLMRASGIDSLGKNGYYFQLSKINLDTHQEEFFISHPKDVVTKSSIEVKIPNGEWKLSVNPVNISHNNYDVFLLFLVGLLFAITGGFFVYTVARRPQKLDHLVQKRTALLQESEEKYRSLIEQASDGIIVYSFDGTIHQFNKSAYTQTGYTATEFAKLNLKDLLANRQMTMAQVKADALQAGKAAILERQLIRKDHSLIDIEINVSMLSDTTLLAFVRNVTDRKNAERALRISEEKFSRVFDADLVGLAICDDATMLIDVNKCFADVLDTTREDMIAKKLLQIAIDLGNGNIGNSRQILAVVNKQLIKFGPVKNQEIIVQKRSGPAIYLLVSVEPLQLMEGHNWLISAVNITEKKNAELSLIQNEMKYRSLIRQASDGIIISNFDGIIKEVNSSMCTMGGYTAAEMLGSHIVNFMPPQDAVELPLRIDELIKGSTLFYERRLLRKDGTVIDVEINSKMAIGNTLIGFVRDITERKTADAALKKSNETFELVAKATNDAILDYDYISHEITGNQNLYNLYGSSAQKGKLNFDSFAARIHPHERERVLAVIAKATSEKAISFINEYRFKTASEEYRHFFDRAYIKYDNDGVPVRILAVMQDITGRIQDRQRLIKEKELSDSIINTLPAVFYLYNENGRFLRWNKNFETVTGYNSDEIKHLHPLDLFEPEEKLILSEKIKNVFLSGMDNVTANFLLKNKQIVPYYFSGMKIDYEGEVCLMGFGIDFSDKVQADKRIKESEQKFRSLVEQASDGVAIFSVSGDALYISPSIERILGYTEQEAMHLNTFSMTHTEDLNAVRKTFEYVLQHPGLPVKGPTSKMLHKNGTWRWFDYTITNMLHAPSINGIVENFRDVTEKLEIEKRIINEKELSDSIINSLPGIFFLFDKTGRYIRWNKNFETITGYGPEEIKYMQPMDFYPAEQKALVKKRIQDVLREKMPMAEFSLLTKNQHKIAFYYNSVAIQYEGQACIMGMGFEATERKKIEQELMVSNTNLELKATELKGSYAELERFAYIVSHDLQEPLRMVSSFLKLLEQKYQPQLDDTAGKYIHFAVDGADRMKGLINDLLEYSRTGTNKDVAADTDMNEVMGEVMNVMKSAIEECQAVVEIAPLPVLAGTSKLQMFQLMQNLLGNSLKYRSDKIPVIKVGVTDEGSQWVFSVSDNGIGFDQKFSEKIFIIFQRLHNKNEFSGTGIGLSICKKIVEKHNGKIWVHSTPGEGSTFYFSIPKK